MARNTKASASNGGKPITAFFAVSNKRSRLPSSPPNASSARLAEKGDSSSPSKNQLSTSPASGAEASVSEPMSPRRSERVKLTVSSLKRAREPETRLNVPSTPTSGRVRNSDRRKSKFESPPVSEGETVAKVVYVKSPSLHQRKKPRVSPPAQLSRPSIPDIVPSSQSDEAELLTTNHQLNGASAANKGVSNKISKLFTPPHEARAADAMEVDDNCVLISQVEPMKNLKLDAEPLNSAAQVVQMLTPPLSDPFSPTPTPVVPKKSIQNVIAAIKARAYAKSISSPDPDELDFQDDLDSSDDDQLPILPLPASKPQNTQRKGKQPDTGPAETRYSLRKFSPPEPKVKTQPKPRGSDPFTALLKEKNQAAKRGNGRDAIEKAELTVLQYRGKDTLLDEMEGEEVEEAAEWGANISSVSVRDILNARNEPKDDSDLELDDRDKERIRGAKGGKTVLKILEQDKAERFKTCNDNTMSGIRLWAQKTDAESSAMAVDENYQISGDSPVVRLLNNSLGCGATGRTSSLLNMNIISAARPTERALIASCLLDISLSPKSSSCNAAAFNALTKFWSSSMQPSNSTIQFKDVLSCLNRFGVDPNILARQNWQRRNAGVCDNLHNRDVVIFRLVSLITACARSGRLRRGEIPDISIAMMLIGMDIGSSPALHRDLTLAIGLSLRGLSPNGSRSQEDEFPCASRVLQLSASYSAVNKLRLLSLLSHGSGPSRRIANFVAYCIITDKQIATSNFYIDLPPLALVLGQLSSPSSVKPPGKFALHEGTDYIDLGFYVAILGVAVSNLKGYVAQEHQKAKSGAMQESPSKMGDKPKTGLQLLHAALETLHSKISDSRAANLERSRTKAAVKQLAMSIHYQRVFWMKHTRETKSITLDKFLKKTT